MKVISGLIQGSPAWHAFRAKHNNASEAAAVFGQHKYMSRNDLFALKAGGPEKEINAFQQKAFDRGHATEAMARPLVVALIGEDLFPVVASDDEDWLAASFDGITMNDNILFEHKLLNQDLVAQVKAGELEPHYYWQLEQQLLISGAEKVIFVTSDGTAENFHHMEYRPVAGRAEQLISGWKQFDADLDAYEHAAPAVEVIGRAPDDLPALRIEVTGMVTASNLDAFKKNALAVFSGINRELSTDSDFANAEKTVKWCAGIEDKLKAAKEHALSQTESIDLLFKTIDGISAEARATRLELEKLVKARKDAVRIEIQCKAEKALFDHIETLNKRLGGKVTMPKYTADFAGAMKGKKTVTSLHDAVDTELARAKIESSTIADKIDINIGSLRELAQNHIFLFSDAQQLVMKANDDLVLLIKSRIADHEKAEAERIEREVQARLAEEQRKAKEAEDRKKAEAACAEAEATRKAEQEVLDAVKTPAIVAPAPIAAAAPAVVATIKPEPSALPCPTNEEILMLVANHFSVSESVAYDWLVAGFGSVNHNIKGCEHDLLRAAAEV